VNQAWRITPGGTSDQERGLLWLYSWHPDDRLAVERDWTESFGFAPPVREASSA
jgi:hypothetical protein